MVRVEPDDDGNRAIRLGVEVLLFCCPISEETLGLYRREYSPTSIQKIGAPTSLIAKHASSSMRMSRSRRPWPGACQIPSTGCPCGRSAQGQTTSPSTHSALYPCPDGMWGKSLELIGAQRAHGVYFILGAGALCDIESRRNES